MFESKHQAAKRTNTNRKDGHLQQVRRQAFLQAIQRVARGDPWDAVVVDPKTKRVLETVRCYPGRKLVQLVSSKYASLNPHLSSTATVKDQGSAICVQDDQVFRNLTLSQGRLHCRLQYRGEANRRAAAVCVLVEAPRGPDPATFWRREPGSKNSTVQAPPLSEYEAARSCFPAHNLPASWYEADSLVAYKAADIFSDAPTGDPQRFKEFTLTGSPDSGSYVSVSLPAG